MERSKMIKGYAFVILSAVIFGLMPLGAKYIYSEGVNAISLVFLRNLMAVPVLGVITCLTGDNLKADIKEIGKMSVIGLFGCTLTPVFLFASYNYLSSGTATVFHYIYPVAVLLIGFIFFREKLKPLHIICTLICTAGIAFFYDPNDKLNLKGAALALVSGLFYATYIVMLSRFKAKSISGFKFNFYVCLVSAVILFIVCVATNSLTFPKTLIGFAVCLLFCIGISVGAIVLFQQGTFIVGGARSSVLSTLEPITSIIAGLLFLNEKVTVLSSIGMILVLLSSFLIAIEGLKSK